MSRIGRVLLVFLLIGGLLFSLSPPVDAAIIVESGPFPDDAMKISNFMYGIVIIEPDDPDNPSGVYVWPVISLNNPGISTSAGKFWRDTATATILHYDIGGNTGTVSISQVGNFWWTAQAIYVPNLNLIPLYVNKYYLPVGVQDKYIYWEGSYDVGAKYNPNVSPKDSIVPVDSILSYNVNQCTYALFPWRGDWINSYKYYYPTSCLGENTVIRVDGRYEVGKIAGEYKARVVGYSWYSASLYTYGGVEFVAFGQSKYPQTVISYSLLHLVIGTASFTMSGRMKQDEYGKYLYSYYHSDFNFADSLNDYVALTPVYKYVYGSYQAPYVSTVTVTYYSDFPPQSVGVNDGSVPTGSSGPTWSDLWDLVKGLLKWFSKLFTLFASIATSLFSLAEKVLSAFSEGISWLAGVFTDLASAPAPWNVVLSFAFAVPVLAVLYHLTHHFLRLVVEIIAAIWI